MPKEVNAQQKARLRASQLSILAVEKYDEPAVKKAVDDIDVLTKTMRETQVARTKAIQKLEGILEQYLPNFLK